MDVSVLSPLKYLEKLQKAQHKIALRHSGAVAQLGEHLTGSQAVEGSTPSRSTIYPVSCANCRVAHLCKSKERNHRVCDRYSPMGCGHCKTYPVHAVGCPGYTFWSCECGESKYKFKHHYHYVRPGVYCFQGAWFTEKGDVAL